MGSQQILLLVLGVILVGVAVVVGIMMFGKSAYNSNAQALMAEVENYRARSLEYWKLPVSMGGASQDITRVELIALASYLGFVDDPSAREGQSTYVIKTENGEFRLDNVQDSAFTIIALGKEMKGTKHPKVTYTYDMLTDTVTSELSAAEGF